MYEFRARFHSSPLFAPPYIPRCNSPLSFTPTSAHIHTFCLLPRETAKALAGKGIHVILAARNTSAAAQVAADILKDKPTAKVMHIHVYCINKI
jgi:hypothetical protein